MAMLLPNVDMSLSKITKTMKKNNKKLIFFFSLFYYILSMHNFLNCVKPLFLFAFKFIQEKEWKMDYLCVHVSSYQEFKSLVKQYVNKGGACAVSFDDVDAQS